MVTKRERVEKNITYCRVQIERFLQRHYKLTFRGDVFANKKLYREKRYAKTSFIGQGKIEVDLDYQMLMEGKKDDMLHAALREAIRIALWYQGRDGREESEDFKNELKKHGLPIYSGLAESGLELHTYVCSECQKIWALKEKKLPPTKDPSQLPRMVTGCCRAPFEYTGKVLYSNEQLQKIREHAKK
ncbi:hypothetical protein [Bacillus mycoides]|uniref:hypothetical protein n=1 Tax=Bacillus mycoides TaxID=1405 RepID=UPI003A800461